MAGRPRFQKMCAEIERRGGEDWVFGSIADGKNVQEIAESLGVSKWLIYDWKNQREERKRQWDVAVRMSAETKAEQGERLLEDTVARGPEVTSAEVSAVTSLVKHKQWLAERLDRDRFGTKSDAVQVNVSFGDLHIGALRRFGQAGKVPELMPAEVVEEAEVEELDDGGDDDVVALLNG